MSQTSLSFAVLIAYVTVALLGVAIGVAAIRTPRYFPVISLLGFGIGTPAIGLGIIRFVRILGFTTNPNDISQQAILLVSFCFSIYCMVHALFLVLEENRAVREARRGLKV